MSSLPPSYTDLSRLYPTNRPIVPTNTAPNGSLIMEEAALLNLNASASLGLPSKNCNLYLQQRLLAMEDSRNALLLARMPGSMSAVYEAELAQQAAVRVSALRRISLLEQAQQRPTAAAEVGLLGATRASLPLRPVSSPTSLMNASVMSLKTPASWAGLAREETQLGRLAQDSLLATFKAQRDSAFANVAKDATAAKLTTMTSTPGASSSSKQTVEPSSEQPQENVEAFFQASSGSKERFPVKLFRMIYEMEKEGRSDVVSFLPHGKAFAIHDEEAFVHEVMPRYFANCQLSSFQKQLNLYGFHKITVGKDRGKLRYFHASFLKGRPSLSNHIQRRRTSASAKRK